MDTRTKGQAAEAAVLKAFSGAGYTVALPFGWAPWDLLVELASASFPGSVQGRPCDGEWLPRLELPLDRSWPRASALHGPGRRLRHLFPRQRRGLSGSGERDAIVRGAPSSRANAKQPASGHPDGRRLHVHRVVAAAPPVAGGAERAHFCGCLTFESRSPRPRSVSMLRLP